MRGSICPCFGKVTRGNLCTKTNFTHLLLVKLLKDDSDDSEVTSYDCEDLGLRTPTKERNELKKDHTVSIVINKL